MLTFLKADLVKAFLKRLKTSKDTQATVLGYVSSCLLLQNIDWTALFKGDKTAEGEFLGAVVVAVFGYITNKPSTTPTPAPGPKSAVAVDTIAKFDGAGHTIQ